MTNKPSQTDTRFTWILISCCLTVIAVAAIWKYPDAVKATSSRDARLGEYIYIDPRSTVHVARKCPKLNYKGWKSKRIKLDDMYFFYKDTPVGDISFCPHCVNDKDYESIISSFSSQLDNRVNEIIGN